MVVSLSLWYPKWLTCVFVYDSMCSFSHGIALQNPSYGLAHSLARGLACGLVLRNLAHCVDLCGLW